MSREKKDGAPAENRTQDLQLSFKKYKTDALTTELRGHLFDGGDN